MENWIEVISALLLNYEALLRLRAWTTEKQVRNKSNPMHMCHKVPCMLKPWGLGTQLAWEEDRPAFRERYWEPKEWDWCELGCHQILSDLRSLRKLPVEAELFCLISRREKRNNSFRDAWRYSDIRPMRYIFNTVGSIHGQITTALELILEYLSSYQYQKGRLGPAWLC